MRRNSRSPGKSRIGSFGNSVKRLSRAFIAKVVPKAPSPTSVPKVGFESTQHHGRRGFCAIRYPPFSTPFFCFSGFVKCTAARTSGTFSRNCCFESGDKRSKLQAEKASSAVCAAQDCPDISTVWTRPAACSRRKAASCSSIFRKASAPGASRTHSTRSQGSPASQSAPTPVKRGDSFSIAALSAFCRVKRGRSPETPSAQSARTPFWFSQSALLRASCSRPPQNSAGRIVPRQSCAGKTAGARAAERARRTASSRRRASSRVSAAHRCSVTVCSPCAGRCSRRTAAKHTSAVPRGSCPTIFARGREKIPSSRESASSRCKHTANGAFS